MGGIEERRGEEERKSIKGGIVREEDGISGVGISGEAGIGGEEAAMEERLEEARIGAKP